MTQKFKLTLVTAALVALGVQLPAQAAGFQLAETSATGLGRAFAGEAASAENPSVQARNPAMLSYLEGRQVSVGAVYVMPEVNTPGNITIDSPLLPQSLTVPADVNDVANNAVVPNFYYSSQLNDRWTWGLALNSNYGLETELPASHAAAIFGNKTSVTTVELNTNIAYKIDRHFTVGGGMRFVYGEGEIGATAPAWIDSVRGLPTLPATVAAQLPASGSELKHLKGDDFGMGWRAGATWQIDDNNRIGFAYSSKVKLDLEGHADGALYSGAGDKVPGYIPLELPAFAELASYHQITDNFALQASINWTDWSTFDELVVYFPHEQKPVSGADSDLVKAENFKDNWRYSIGGTYQATKALTLRAGMALDKTAVTDEHRTITIPDSDRLWFSLGAGYALSDAMTVDLGVTYIEAHGDSPINETQSLLNLAQVTYQGEATGHVWLAGLQFTYKM
ncbi:outer membrane protein transport protein [Shewanella sp.]|uniref:outer membrane protein transport protein n=1 Tax=Shewanella sp. TaxID=50422 RepID=UPI003A9857E1